MRILLIDNYDSFTYNLYQLLADVFGEEPQVIRNDQLTWPELQKLHYDAVVISPGPGTPLCSLDIGICADIIRLEAKPILGVCLGYQAICHLEGGLVERAPTPVHGRSSAIYHDGSGIFKGIPSPFQAVRYHSLIARAPSPAHLRKTAWTSDELVMAVEHETKPLWGVQFHPESILSDFGRQLIENFRDLVAAGIDELNHATQEQETNVFVSSETRSPKQTWVMDYRCLAEYIDPAIVFEAIYGESPNAFWLDSSMVHEETGRFSFMGDASAPHSEVLSYSLSTGLTTETREGSDITHIGDFLNYLEQKLDNIELKSVNVPFPFIGGYVGYLGYELKELCGYESPLRSNYPDAGLIFPGRYLCFDEIERKVYAVALAPQSDQSALDRLDDWSAEIAGLLPKEKTEQGKQEVEWVSGDSVRWEHDRERYLELIDECLEKIYAGESYEICLTNRLYGPVIEDPLSVYLRLRELNPAPFSAYLKFPDLDILCSSPEQFLRVDSARVVTSRPIKGTRRRGATREEDEELKEDLARSEKDRSENLMITDLLRNDLGTVCEIGSVSVPDLMRVETYQTVHQLVTTVQGRLAPGKTVIDCLRATFPGGSMTGAPKRRTMEIIDRFESVPRGVYSGSIGFFSLNGLVDLNIVIRTIVTDRKRSMIGAGGAIIALSEPHEEFAEIELKTTALLNSVSSSSTVT